MVAIAYGDRRTPIYPRCVPPRDGAGVPAPMKLGCTNPWRPDGAGEARGATAARLCSRGYGASEEGSWLP